MLRDEPAINVRFLGDTVEKLKSQLTTEFRGAPIEADIW